MHASNRTRFLLAAILAALLAACASPGGKANPDIVAVLDAAKDGIHTDSVALVGDRAVVHGACPFECCTYRDWTIQSRAVVRARPYASAAEVGRIELDETVHADSGLVLVNPLGLAVVRRDTVENAWRGPANQKPADLDEHALRLGDTIRIIDGMGEGYFRVHWRDSIMSLEGLWTDSDSSAVKLIRHADSEWWAYITARNGALRGWVMMNDVKSAARTAAADYVPRVKDNPQQALWIAVDDYIDSNVLGEDAELEAVLEASAAAGLPAIAVSPAHGKFLHLIARIRGAKSVLEIGTLGGYSTICLARAVGDDGKVITLEIDEKHAGVARDNFERAGMADRIELRLGAAVQTLPALAEENAGPFDLTFIDADKVNIPAYFEWALRMSKPGSIIIVDNVVRNGAVVDAESIDASVVGVRALNDLLSSEDRVSATTIQTVGIKGYDGFTLAVVN